MKIQCPACQFSRDVPDDKIPASAKMATCPKCSHKFNFREPEDAAAGQQTEDIEPHQAESAQMTERTEQSSDGDIWSKLESLGEDDDSASDEDRTEAAGWNRTPESDIPWEELHAYGFFPGFFQTIKRVMLSPGSFFQAMFLGRGFNKPLIFYLLVAEIQALAQFFWQMTGVVPQMQSSSSGLLGLGMMGLGSIFLLVLYPVILSIMLFIVSGLNHLCLRIVRDGSRGYEGTFRVISYANAPMVLAVVPSMGPLIGVVWTFICTFIGFKTIHRTSSGKVLAAMLLPLLFALVLSSFIFMIKGIPQM
jgi:predicted Zn finger-like uncharacterized protein